MYPWFLWHDRKTSCSWCALSKPFLILQRSIMNSSSLWWTNTNFSISFYRNTFWSFDHTHLCFYTVIYPAEIDLILAITCLMKPIDLYIGFYVLPSNTFGPLFCFLFWAIHGTSPPVCQCTYSKSKQSIQTYKRYKFSLRGGGKMMLHLLRLNVLLQLSTSASTYRSLLLSLREN